MNDLKLLRQAFKGLMRFNDDNIDNLDQCDRLMGKFDFDINTNDDGKPIDIEIAFKDISLRGRHRYDMGDISAVMYIDAYSGSNKRFPDIWFANPTTDIMGNKYLAEAAHPHISAGTACFGGFEGRLHQAWNSCQPLVLVLLLNKFLRTWYLDSSYWNINRMPELKSVDGEKVLFTGIKAEQIRRQASAALGRNCNPEMHSKIAELCYKTGKSAWAIGQAMMKIHYIVADSLNKSMTTVEMLGYHEIRDRMNHIEANDMFFKDLTSSEMDRHRPGMETRSNFMWNLRKLREFTKIGDWKDFVTEKLLLKHFNTILKVFLSKPEVELENHFDISKWQKERLLEYKFMQKMLDIENWKKHLVQRWKDELGTYSEDHRSKYTHELYPVTFYDNLYKQARFEALTVCYQNLIKKVRRVKNEISNTENAGIQTDLFSKSST